jgi:rod shape-determining protein MreD
MSWFVAIIALLAGALIQCVSPAAPFAAQVKWPVLMGIVIYYALVRDLDVMLAVAFFAGLFQDVLSPIPLGYSSVCFMAAGVVINGVKNLVLTDSLMTMALVGVVTGLAVTTAMYMLLFRAGLLACGAETVIGKIVCSAAYGAVFTPVVCRAVGMFDRRMGNVEMRGDIDDVD